MTTTACGFAASLGDAEEDFCHLPRIVIVSSSPSARSKSRQIAEHAAELCRKSGADVELIQVRDLPPMELMQGETSEARIAGAIVAVARAHGVIVITPTYKAAYAGMLKVFLDILPQTALTGKTVLPLATGGSLAHVLALDYGLRPVLQSMDAGHVVKSCFILDDWIGNSDVSMDKATSFIAPAIDRFMKALPTVPRSMEVPTAR